MVASAKIPLQLIRLLSHNDCIYYSHISHMTAFINISHVTAFITLIQVLIYDLLCIFIYANTKTSAERFANQACRSGFGMETAILEFSTKWIAHVLQKHRA